MSHTNPTPTSSHDPDNMKFRIASLIARRVSGNLYSLGYSETGCNYVYDVLTDKLLELEYPVLEVMGKELSIPVDTAYGEK